MKEIMDEVSQIPFEIFWDKWQELKPSICNRQRAEKEWFYMREPDRIKSFEYLCNNHPMLQIVREPYLFLIHFQMPLLYEK